MANHIIEPPKLNYFLSSLNKKFGKFVVLRGYEFLPTGYTNDIDVYVPKNDIARFFDCIKNIDGLDINISILISRLGLIKCELNLDGEIIPFDIMYGFYYFGLEYQDCAQLHENSKLHDSKLFYTPSLSDEIRISLLKELLHNKRVRFDKANYLQEKISLCSSELPTEYFNSVTVEVLRNSILEKKLYLPKVSLSLKKALFIYNVRTSLINTVRNITLFACVKYIFKNHYHNKIIK